MTPTFKHPLCRGKFDESLIASDKWVAEPKIDGARAFMYVEGGRVRFLMRSKIVRALPVVPYNPILEGCILDGEIYDDRGFNQAMSGILGGNADNLKFAAFDLPFLKGRDMRYHPYFVRKTELAELVTDVADSRLEYVPNTLPNAFDKLILYNLEVEAGREGVILKKTDLSYGLDTWVKMKKFCDVSVIVIGQDPQHPERFAIALHDAARIGHVKIPAGQGIPGAGTVIDISVLSFDKETISFRHPSFLRKRPDLNETDCTVAEVVSAIDRQRGRK